MVSPLLLLLYGCQRAIISTVYKLILVVSGLNKNFHRVSAVSY